MLVFDGPVVIVAGAKRPEEIGTVVVIAQAEVNRTLRRDGVQQDLEVLVSLGLAPQAGQIAGDDESVRQVRGDLSGHLLQIPVGVEAAIAAFRIGGDMGIGQQCPARALGIA